MTEAEKAFCVEWCKAHAKTWQVLNRSQWKYQFHPKTLVRYVDEIRQTEGEVKLLLEFLSSSDCIATLSLYDQSVSGSWAPTRAWLEVSNKSVQGVKAVRLFHGLQTEGDGDDGPYVILDGCAYKVSFTYCWNKATLPNVTASESGVQYQLTNAVRDPETGLWNYVIEKRERVQQDIAEYLSGETTFERVKEEAHFGVKEGRSAGKSASAGDGKLVRRKVTKNDDCTHNVENTTVEEKAVAGASERVEVSLDGKTVTTVNRNMASKASTDGLEIGESVENAKTDGGRWNQTIRKLTRFFYTLGERCKKTAFAHSHGKTTVQGTDPGFAHVSEAGGGKVTQKSVTRTETGAYKVDEETTQEQAVAGAQVGWRKTLRGIIKSVTNRSQPSALNGSGMAVGEKRTSEKTEGGLWNNTVEQLEHTPVGTIGEGCEQTAVEHTHTKTENVADKPTVETTAGVNVKRSVTARMTEEGSWDKTTSETTWRAVSGTANGGAIHANRVTTVTRNATSPSVSPSPSPGVTVEASVSPNDHGTFDKHVTVTTREKIEGTVSGKGAMKAKRTVKVIRNATDQSVSETPSPGETVIASVTPNEDGTFDKHIEVVKREKFEGTATSETATGKYTTTVAVNDTSGSVDGFRANIHPNDDGTFTTTKTEYEAKAIDSGWIEWETVEKTPRSKITYSCGIRVFENLDKVPSVKSDASCGISAHINEAGKYCGHMTYKKLKSWEESSAGSEGSGTTDPYWIRCGNPWKNEDEGGLMYQTWQKVKTRFVKGGISATMAASYADKGTKYGHVGDFYTFTTIVETLNKKVSEGEPS